MKELSIEEKAKAYDKALKVAKDIINGKATYITDGTPVIEAIFPELKESEDESLREDIKEILDKCLNIRPQLIEEPKYLKAIAWLEKHDVQKPADKVEPKFKVGDVVTNKKSKDTVKIVQILHDSYCYSGWDGAAIVHSDFSISEQDDWELVEQNPAWSEEDESNLDSAIYYIRREPYRESDVEPIVDWLKSLKDRVQPQFKKEWSEDDIKTLNRISTILVDASEVKNWWKEYRIIEREEMIKLTDFLKSLKDRVQSK